MISEKTKKIAAGIGLVLVGGMAGAAAFSAAVPNPEPQVVEVVSIVEKQVPVEVPVEVTKVVNQTVEVPVLDKELAGKLCDRLVYDDINECIEEVEAEDVALQKAFKLILEDGLDELDDEGLIEDEDEAEFVTLYTDFEDIKVVKSDFDDDEYRFEVKVKVDDEDADEKFKAVFTVHVEDGEAEIVDVEED